MTDYRDNIRKLMITVNRIDGLYYLIARKSGIKYNTLTLLYALSDGKQHSQKQICKDWLIPRTTINTVVKECVEAGYVTLTAIGNREKSVSLTDKGKSYANELLEKLMSAEKTAMEKTLENYSADFVPAFEQFAEELGEALEPILEKDS